MCCWRLLPLGTLYFFSVAGPGSGSATAGAETLDQEAVSGTSATAGETASSVKLSSLPSRCSGLLTHILDAQRQMTWTITMKWYSLSLEECLVENNPYRSSS